MQHTLKNEINCHPTKGMFKIITILLFCFFCNAMSFTVLTCLEYVEYESQYILQQPGSLKNIVMWTHIYVLIHPIHPVRPWYYNWTLFL